MIRLSYSTWLVSLACCLPSTFAIGCGNSTRDYEGGGEALELPPVYQDELCDRYANIQLGGYMIQNNVWNSSAQGDQCITAHWDGESDDVAFVVRPDPSIRSDDGVPASYASVVYGWHFGSFSSGYPEARQLGDIETAPSSWIYSVPGSGTYNVAYDLWLHPTNPNPGNPGGGLELMIWVSYIGASPIGTSMGSVELGNARWDVWVGTNASWDVVTFRRVGPPIDIDLKEFIDRVPEVSSVALDDSWYLLGVQAGFEIWDGRNSFTTQSFRVDVE